MKRPKIHSKKGPEAIIQRQIINFLTLRGWFVKSTHGNMYQSGFPDLYACKRRYGTRWIEVKNPLSYKFTPAQMEDFSRLTAEGVGIWILVAATELEYKKLFLPPNWWSYLHVPNMNP